MDNHLSPLPRSLDGSVPSRDPLLRNMSSGHSLLLDASDGGFPRTQPKLKRRYCYRALKGFGLNIVYTIWAKWRGRDVPEEEKMAFDNSRRMAIINSLIHWIPLLGAGLLVALNMIQYYVGGDLAGENGQNTQKLAALQFAAKLHELFMLASISTTTFAYIRHQMTFGDGVTLGTVFAGQGFKSISNLWSIEFWSAVYDARAQKKGTKSQKWWMVILIALATVLGVAVGPSSANLMRPRLDKWPAGGTTFWLNATSEQLFPEVMNSSTLVPASCLNYTGDMLCPYGNFESFIEQRARYWPTIKPQGMLPGNTIAPSLLAHRLLVSSPRTSPDNNSTVWKHGAPTDCTSPLAAVADAISETTRHWSYAAASYARGKRFKYRVDVSFSVEALQPHAEVHCRPVSAEGLTAADNVPLIFEVRNGSSGWDIYDYGEPFGLMYGFNSEFVQTQPKTSKLLQRMFSNSTDNFIEWIDDSRLLDSTESSLVAIVGIPQSSYGIPVYLCCTINTFFQHTTSVGTRNKAMEIDFSTSTKEPQAVVLSAEWASYLNPYLPEQRMDVFSAASLAAGLSQAHLPITRSNYVTYAVESIIGDMIANGMSRMPYGTTLAGQLKGTNDSSNDWYGGTWANELLPITQLGWGGHAYEITPQEEAQATQFEIKVRVEGYAYSREGIAQKAAMLVLLMYCVLAMASIGNSWRNSLTSGAWDTTPELTALAFNSDRNPAMYNTGGGIDSIRTMEHRVVVRSKNDRLEMIFPDTHESGDLVNPRRLYH